jgi:hypothetical protein
LKGGESKEGVEGSVIYMNITNNIRDLPRWCRTVRYLRLRQILYRLKYAVTGLDKKAPPLSLAWKELTPKCPALKNGRPVKYLGHDRFCFNNVEGVLQNRQWNDPAKTKLWLYNLHYHEWLFDLDQGHIEWMERWIEDNPPYTGEGWDPYPLSLRLFNWIKLLVHCGIKPSPEILESLGLQAGFLFRNLEFQHGANHLLENLLALKAASLFMQDAGAVEKIHTLLADELEEQFLADGGHYERSPMYHAVLLERMLDLINIWPSPPACTAEAHVRRRVIPESERTRLHIGEPGSSPGRRLAGPGSKDLYTLLLRKAEKALDWLESMSVKGALALFNDSSYDAAPNAGPLLEYARKLCPSQNNSVSKGKEEEVSGMGNSASSSETTCRLPLTSYLLPSSGYHRFHNHNYTLIWDCGPLGPDYNLAHAHCDMLSFCLWIGDVPVIVDSGNYEYLPGEMRDYCRSTAAHNTCTIDDREQAEMWLSHRTGRRGRPLDIRQYEENDSAILEGCHDGYVHLKGRPVHHRKIRLQDDKVCITDRVNSQSKHLLKSFIHLHPDAEVSTSGFKVEIKQGNIGCTIECEASPQIRDGWYCPELGKKIRSRVVVLSVKEAETGYIIYPLL